MAASLEDLVSMAMFARVVEAKSFTAASRTLEVSKSAVSKRVAELEARLGARLLHRTTRNLSLTPEGARLYERCLELVRTADEAPELVRGHGDEPRGILRVNCPMVLADMYLTTWIAEFVQRHPQVQVELSVNNAMVDLISERVDVAIRMSHSLASSSLVARRLATVAKYACASPAYLAAHGTPRTPEELRNHACLRFSPLRVEAEWKFESGRSSVVIPASGPFSSDSAEALRSAALAGMGIIVLPTFFLMDDLAQGRLVRVLENHRVPSLGIFAVYAKGKVVPAKVRKFVDLVAARMRPAPWER